MSVLLAVWLAWDAVTGATPPVQGYRIYYGPESGLQYIFKDVGNVTTGQVTDIPAGARIYFVVRAYNSEGESPASNEVVWVEPVPTPTPTPTPVPTPTPTPTPSPTVVPTPTPTPTPSPTPRPKKPERWWRFSRLSKAISKSDTWTGLTETVGPGTRTGIYYVANHTVGTGHTFTVSGTSLFQSLIASAFSGVATASPFDVENGAGSAGATSIATGSVTPSQANSLIVTTVGSLWSSHSIDSGFTEIADVAYSAGNHFSIAAAYLVQSAASAVNPTWSGPTSEDSAARIAVFKP